MRRSSDFNKWTGQTQYQQNTHKVSQVKVFIELNQRFQSVELLYVIIIYVLMIPRNLVKIQPEVLPPDPADRQTNQNLKHDNTKHSVIM